MRRIISAPLLALFLTAGLLQVPAVAQAAPAQAAAPLELAPNAPARYTIVRGDTLWDISGKYLKSPWRWPELWRVNKDDIKNPHLIYPGQVLLLSFDADGRPRLCIEGRPCGEDNRDVKLEPKIYVEPNKKAIASIPYDLIRPYLERPLVMDIEQLDRLPRVVSAENDRIALGAGDKIFATGIPSDGKQVWHSYRQGKALSEIGSREVLGYEAIYTGSARLTVPGEPSTLLLTRSAQEVGRGDKLIPEVEPSIISYMPRAPEKAMRGEILSIYGTVGHAGRYSVVSFSRGAKDGVEVGHVFNLMTAGREVDERFNGIKRTYQTPAQQTGLIFVFQVFDRVAYGLIMTADDPIRVGDIVTSPGQ
ncbi:MAG TPA: LysM peptidoglycan-binding domain-containing protein [Rhodocyclaceae bacterium]|nr:LysM peptidoglycan-binding domain-containing protein [Rhodocyclaceae bacterium]